MSAPRRRHIDRKDHFMLAEYIRLNAEQAGSPDLRTLQDEQLSDIFPLHNDKQHRHSASQRTAAAKPEFSGRLVEPDGIEPTT